MPEPVDPGPAPASGPHAHPQPQPVAFPVAGPMGMPPWLLGLLSLIGIVIGGGAAGYGGGTQASKDIAKLETKVDTLVHQINELEKSIIRYHALDDARRHNHGD